jgi:predicted nucleotidyltransferase
MNRSEALETLRRSEPDLRARGVRRAAVFGSVARGDSRPDSDIDIMVEIDPEAHLTVFDYAGLKDYIASLFDGPVDVVNRDGLKPYVRPAATADAIYAFQTGRRRPSRHPASHRPCCKILGGVRPGLLQARHQDRVRRHAMPGDHFRSFTPLAG